MLRPSISIWEPTQVSAGTYTANTVHELREDVKVVSFIFKMKMNVGVSCQEALEYS